MGAVFLKLLLSSRGQGVAQYLSCHQGLHSSRQKLQMLCLESAGASRLVWGLQLLMLYHWDHFGLPHLLQLFLQPLTSQFSHSLSFWYCSTGISTSISTALICFLSNADICSWFASSCLCVWNWNSQRILALVVLGHFRRCMPSGLTNFSSISSTDVPDSRGNLCTDSTLGPAIFTFLVLVYVWLVPAAHLFPGPRHLTQSLIMAKGMVSKSKSFGIQGFILIYFFLNESPSFGEMQAYCKI